MEHLVGNIPELPTPMGNHEDTSLAVLQFVALMRGEWAVRAPQSQFRVARVFAERRYCLGCYGVRWFDVISGVSGQRLVICRCCGKES